MATQKKQLIIGFGAIASVAVLILLVWCGMFIPGLVGRFFSTLVGVFSTPFLLEPAFFLVGLILILTINHIRRKREGDELVYLEQVDTHEAISLPSHSRSAIYTDKPLEQEGGIDLAVIEGAIATGDLDIATEQLLTLDPSDLKKPSVLRLRIELAEKRGDTDQASLLKKKLKQSG